MGFGAMGCGIRRAFAARVDQRVFRGMKMPGGFGCSGHPFRGRELLCEIACL